jgi:hypothetical protein
MEAKHGPETRDHGVLIMRKPIATVFNYSLDGFLADEGTEFWKFCFDLLESVSPTTRRNSPFSRARTRTSWAPSFRRHPERRAQGRLLPDPEDGRVGQHHHRLW